MCRALALWVATLFSTLAQVHAQERAQAQGPPTVVSIFVEGRQRYTEAQLLGVLGQKVGEPLDAGALDRGLQRLWTSFHVLPDVRVREVSGGIELHLIVEELPVDRDPRFIGNDAIDDKTLRKWALLDEKSELYLHQAGRVRQRLLEGYRKDGFYFAEVNVITREGDVEGELPDVIFEIREGHKVRVRDFVIEGNRSMPDRRFLYFFKDGLSSLAKRDLEGPSLFNWLGSAFVEETLQADLLALRGVYRDRGWLDAVVELADTEFNDAHDRVTVHVAVDEGERYTIASLAIKAVEWNDPDSSRDTTTHDAELLFPEADLLALCTAKTGAYFESTAQRKDLGALRDYYGARGHISHSSLPRRLNWTFAEPDLLFDVEHHTVAVTYRVVQGHELYNREILINGTQHTRDAVVRRELSVFPGKRTELKEIERSLARVQATRFFTDEMNRAAHRDPYYRLVPVAGEPDKVDIEFIVEEGRVIDFNISGGVDTDNGAFAIMSLTMRNFDATDLPRGFGAAFGEIYGKEAFHGAGQQLDFVASPGTQVSNMRIHFVEPDIFGTHLQPTSFDIDLNKRLRRYASHEEDRADLRTRLGRRWDYDIFTWIGFVLTEIELSNPDSDGVPPALSYQESQGKTRLAGVLFDASTRSLDNYLVPHKGWWLRSNNVVYSRDLGSDYDYMQNDLRTDFYAPIGEKEDGTKPVLHVQLDLGAQSTYGDTFAVPYSDRYFLGGSKSLRGFDYRGVGPFDLLTDYPLGGQTSLSGTVEYFYPLHSIQQPGSYQRIEAMRASVFVDFGATDAESWQLDLGELRSSVGFSIGLSYPLPLTLNFGFPMTSFEGDNRQTFSFSLGTP